MSTVNSASKKKTEPTGPVKGLSRAADGHTLLDGAVWHTPKSGSPTECEIPTCDRVLGSWRDHNPLAAFDGTDQTDDQTDTEETPAA